MAAHSTTFFSAHSAVGYHLTLPDPLPGSSFSRPGVCKGQSVQASRLRARVGTQQGLQQVLQQVDTGHMILAGVGRTLAGVGRMLAEAGNTLVGVGRSLVHHILDAYLAGEGSSLGCCSLAYLHTLVASEPELSAQPHYVLALQLQLPRLECMTRTWRKHRTGRLRQRSAAAASPLQL